MFNQMVNRKSNPLSQIFHALADTTRRALLAELASGSRSVSELSAPHAMSLAAISKHLKVLENAGLITRVKRGREHHISLHPPPLEQAQSWLDFYRHFWEARIDLLERVLDEDAAQAVNQKESS